MILTRQSIEMGPEGYIEIDMDGDDELIDAMTYDEMDHTTRNNLLSCRQYEPLTAAPSVGAAVL